MADLFPGVPALLFPPVVSLGLKLLSGDGAFFPASLLQQWGIFKGGLPVILADTVVAVDYKQDWVLATAPLEKGAFVNYDKVSTPFSVRIRYAKGGSVAELAAFIASVKAIAGDLNLYTATTPEAVYPSCNVVHYDYRRTATNGAGLVQIDVWLMEVRIAAQTPSFENTQSPSGANPENGGTVQAQPLKPKVAVTFGDNSADDSSATP